MVRLFGLKFGKSSSGSIEKLLSIAGEPLSDQPVWENVHDFDSYGKLGGELLDLLRRRNGFYAFDSALHVFPAGPFVKEMTLSKWNSPDLWRHEYHELADKRLFFAEDAFGCQFCLYKGRVCSFDPETGDTKPMGRTMEEWAEQILADSEVLTGYPLLHQWQANHGALPIGQRLVPATPFVLGGEYALENLNAVDADDGMRFRGSLARQIKDLPDGAQIELKVID